MIKLLFNSIFTLGLFVGVVLEAYAETKSIPTAIFIDQVVEVGFPPEDAFFFVEFDDGSIRRERAILLPPQGDENKRTSSGNWLMGSRVDVPRDTQNITFSLIILGRNSKFAFVPPTTWDLRKKLTFAGSTELLREHLLQRKDVLRSWTVQKETQETSLKRLEADAEVIADVGRILEVREENERLKLATDAIVRDIASLQQSLVIAKNLPAPKNYSTREVELTQQLTELATIAKEAEGSEYSRRSYSEADLKRRLEIIESTRFDDIDELQRELDLLKRKRQVLENRKERREDRSQPPTLGIPG